MAYFLAPSADARPQFFDSQGAVLAGGWMYWYAATTTTPQDTFTTSAGSVANSNPIELDGSGRPKNAVGIYLTEGLSYKLVVKDSALNTIFTQDNIVGIQTAVTTSEWLSSALTPTYISAATFSFPGDQTTDAHEARRLKIVDAGGTKYGTITGTAFTTLTTVTVAVDAGGSLQNPITSVSWGILRADNPSVHADVVNRKGNAVVSAATCDIWSTNGNYLHITGSTGPITSFGTAPYAGAQRTLIFDSTPTLTHNATTLQIEGGANVVMAAGDRAEVRADTTANMIVTKITRASGVPVVGTQTANTFFAGPTSGAAAAPAFRAAVGADGASLVLLANGTAAVSATVDFTTGLSSTYDEYLVTVTDMRPATDGVNFWLRISQDAGVSFKSAAGNYRWAYNVVTDGGANAPAGSAGSTVIQMTATIGNAAASTCSGWVRFSGPSGTAANKKFRWEFTDQDAAGTINMTVGGGAYTADQAAINAIRFMASSGNITSGTFALYGIRKS